MTGPWIVDESVRGLDSLSRQNSNRLLTRSFVALTAPPPDSRRVLEKTIPQRREHLVHNLDLSVNDAQEPSKAARVRAVQVRTPVLTANIFASSVPDSHRRPAHPGSRPVTLFPSV